MYFAISLGLINFGLYCFQQFGMALGIGAETVLLVAYLHSIRDGVVDEEEKGFARATRHVMDAGLFLILATGAGVVITQYLMGQPLSIFSTAFLFKWSLLGIILVMTLVNRGSSLVSGLLQGLAAGTWYAMFVVHILAPEASWQQFGEFYGAWLVGFMVCWTVLVFALKGKTPAGMTKPAPVKSVPQPAVIVSPAPKAAPLPPLFPSNPPSKPTQNLSSGSGKPGEGSVSAPAVSAVVLPTASPQLPKEPQQNPVASLEASQRVVAQAPTPAIELQKVTIAPAPVVAPAPTPPTTPPGAFIGLNVMPKDPKDIEKR
ncbi:MAG TPA: hypothetical protein VG984_00040 [Candidatus Paceibacterota bacterium]|nr:hypothetical protein [Candidatus Paceibacterota bacterium]